MVEFGCCIPGTFGKFDLYTGKKNYLHARDKEVLRVFFFSFSNKNEFKKCWPIENCIEETMKRSIRIVNRLVLCID